MKNVIQTCPAIKRERKERERSGDSPTPIQEEVSSSVSVFLSLSFFLSFFFLSFFPSSFCRISEENAHFGTFHCSKKLVSSQNVELARVVEISRGYCSTVLCIFFFGKVWR